MPDLSGGATDLKLHVSDQQVNAVLCYVSPDNNELNKYQEYFAYAIRRLLLENPSNYQHALQLFGVLRDAALNDAPVMSLYIRNKHRFFLDNTIKLVHVNAVRHGGWWGEGWGLVPAADSFVCRGSIRDLEKVRFSENS